MRVVKAAAVPTATEENFTAIESPALQFLPRGEEVPGWRLEKDPIVIPGEKLGAYLAHEANEFVHYNAIDVTAGSYVPMAGAGFADVEIFRFPDFVKAFGAYSMHKRGPQTFVNIQNEAFISTHSVHVWRGPFYIRVTGGASEGPQALVRLAATVADRMPAAPARPAVFNFLPPTGMIPTSLRYSADQGFGQRFLGNSFQADYNVDGALITGLIIPAASPQAASQIVAAYRNLYLRNGKLMDPIANLGEENFTAEDRYLGRTVCFRIDRFVLAFNGFNERQKIVDIASAADQRILGSIGKQLVTAEKQSAQPQRTSTTDSAQPAWMQRPR